MKDGSLSWDTGQVCRLDIRAVEGALAVDEAVIRYWFMATARWGKVLGQ